MGRSLGEDSALLSSICQSYSSSSIQTPQRCLKRMADQEEAEQGGGIAHLTLLAAVSAQ